MAYTPATAQLYLHLDGNVSHPGVPRVFTYSSTHNSTDILATGFFTACGDGGKSLNNVGLRVGDLVLNCPTTVSNTKATMHVVSASTANVASTSASSASLMSFGFDCTCATAT